MSNDKLRIIDQALNKYLPKKGKLAEAMRYSIFAGGKRFRPMLCFATAEVLGKNKKSVLSLACAIEMVHTFTLIHDDLPAMDNSDLRRGQPSCHKKFDEAIAILAGDALNTLAFEVLAKEGINSKVIELLAKSLNQVVLGQVMDIESEEKKPSLEELIKIHQLKTSAMLIAAVEGSALISKADRKQQKNLADFARHLGIAFQIADDILDLTSSTKALGKPAGIDKNKGFPHLVGLEKAQKLAQEEKAKALKALLPFGSKAQTLRGICDYAVDRKA